MGRRGAAGAVRLAVALTLAGALTVAAAPGGRASAADPLEDAKARVAAARESADAATARYHEAQTRHAEVVRAIEELEAVIRAGRDRVRALRAQVRRLAVTAYTTAGTAVPLGALGGEEPLTAARRQKLLDQVAGVDTAAVAELVTLDEELGRQRRALEAQRAEAEEALAAMDEEAAALQAELAAAQAAAAEVEEEIRRLEASRQEAERRRLEAEEQARQEAARAAGPAEPTGSAPVAAGDMICPIRGPVSFIDSWGHPRPQGRHMGVDLMAARGTPNVAVVSGEVRMRSPGGLPGLGVHLTGDDGNLYYYFHLDSYEGGSRRVAQGEVIGYTGNTGDASGGPTHTHFEVHPDGGGAVNPYPYVAAVC